MMRKMECDQEGRKGKKEKKCGWGSGGLLRKRREGEGERKRHKERQVCVCECVSVSMCG